MLLYNYTNVLMRIKTRKLHERDALETCEKGLCRVHWCDLPVDEFELDPDRLTEWHL